MEDEVSLDMDAAQAAMDNEFGSGDTGGDKDPLPLETQESAAASTSAQAGAQPAATPLTTPPGAQPPAWATPPKSWKKDYHPHYQGLADPVKQYLHEREKQALDGIMHYKTQVDPYERMASQYKPFLEQAGASMPEVAESMLRAHIALTYGDDQSKAQFLHQLIEGYGLQPLLQQMYGMQQAQGQQGQGQFDPSVMTNYLRQYHEQAIAPIAARVSAWEKAQEQEKFAASQKEVDSFFADPQNKHAAEVGPDMIDLMKNGIATTLKDAYEKACHLNPTVRAKLMQEAIEAATKSPARPPRNVRSGQTPPASTKQDDAGQDMEATMRETLRSINNR